MPVMNFDLEDGLPPVMFTLKPSDVKRFMDFMAECQSALSAPVTPTEKLVRVRHAEGGSYDHIGAANGAGQSAGAGEIEVYRGKDGRLWYRTPADFRDRFESVTDHPTLPNP